MGFVGVGVQRADFVVRHDDDDGDECLGREKAKAEWWWWQSFRVIPKAQTAIHRVSCCPCFWFVLATNQLGQPIWGPNIGRAESGKWCHAKSCGKAEGAAEGEWE